MESSTTLIALLVGGLVPAICFGASGALTRSATSGTAIGPYMIIYGVTVAIFGALWLVLSQDWRLSMDGARFTLLSAIFWAIGCGMVAGAVIWYAVPISKLVPLYNTNSLVAVTLGLLLYGEGRSLDVQSLLLGTVLIVLGAALVCRA